MLATYLNGVGANLNEFEKHHEWRMKYETYYRAQDVELVRFCELCHKLNTNKDRIWYMDLNKFFSEADE